MLYTNGYNVRGRSTRYPNGLLYYDGSAVFGVAFYRKRIEDAIGHIILVAPRGPAWLESVTKFVSRMKNDVLLPGMHVYIRYLLRPQMEALLAQGYLPITEHPWHPLAHSEDETYPHQLVSLEEIIEYDPSGEMHIKTLEDEGSRNFRRKARKAYRRFENFLARNQASLVLTPYEPEVHGVEAQEIVAKHFKSLREPVGSTPEDYLGLLHFSPPSHATDNFFARIGYLQRHQQRLPLIWFTGEKIGQQTFAVYASFALRREEEILTSWHSTGYSAITQYMYLKLFGEFWQHGIIEVNLGGSETLSLDRFKRQLGAKPRQTYWVVAP
ncbi:MAG: hypothetical protein D6694_12675 [Gammaproteobacteria bacterium]|nr:MAG: hypothetical protein D6694_12675 [Gammaproteobacteria bacterium]